jgi:hypothetical protein
MKKYLYVLALVIMLGIVEFVSAQTPSSSTQTAGGSSSAPDRLLGEVTAVDTVARQLTLSAAAGKKVLVKLDEKTIFRRVLPGEKTLEKAVEITFGEIAVGDRVLARGTAADDKKEVLVARAVVVMSKAEITRKRERDRAEWLRRGIVGVVTATNPATRELTLRASAPEGSQSIIVAAGDGVRFRRYAPDSVNFSDARASSFDELKVGDQLRALGERSADGASYKAEEIVFGTFRTIGGTVVASSAASELTIKDIKTNQPLTVVVTKDSVLRRFTPELVKLLEQSASNSGAQPRGSGGDLQNTIESLPPMTLADLKPGDAILISSSAGANSSRVTAVLIAAGVEDFFKRQEKTGAQRELNLGLGLPAGVVP